MKDTYHYAMIYRKIHRNERQIIDFDKITVDDPFYLYPEKTPSDYRYMEYAGKIACEMRGLPSEKRNLQIKKQAFQIIVRPTEQGYSLLMGLRAYACLKELGANKVKVFVCDYQDRKAFEKMLCQRYMISPRKVEVERNFEEKI